MPQRAIGTRSQISDRPWPVPDAPWAATDAGRGGTAGAVRAVVAGLVALDVAPDGGVGVVVVAAAVVVVGVSGNCWVSVSAACPGRVSPLASDVEANAPVASTHAPTAERMSADPRSRPAARRHAHGENTASGADHRRQLPPTRRERSPNRPYKPPRVTHNRTRSFDGTRFSAVMQPKALQIIRHGIACFSLASRSLLARSGRALRSWCWTHPCGAANARM